MSKPTATARPKSEPAPAPTPGPAPAPQPAPTPPAPQPNPDEGRRRRRRRRDGSEADAPAFQPKSRTVWQMADPSPWVVRSPVFGKLRVTAASREAAIDEYCRIQHVDYTVNDRGLPAVTDGETISDLSVQQLHNQPVDAAE